jgi:uncharacterized membrane protein YraQ (UPF0718 family)
MAFLISSPLLSPVDFLNTWGLLGSEFALVRVFSALLIGNAFGALIHFLDRKGFLEYPTNGHEEKTRTGDTMVVTASALSPSRWGALKYYLWKTSKYTAKYFFLSLVLAGLTNTLIPRDRQGLGG